MEFSSSSEAIDRIKWKDLLVLLWIYSNAFSLFQQIYFSVNKIGDNSVVKTLSLFEGRYCVYDACKVFEREAGQDSILIVYCMLFSLMWTL